MAKLSSAMEKILDVEEEKQEEIIEPLKKISQKGDVFIAIIASYVGRKVTPSRSVSASVGISEEFGIETAIDRIKEGANDCANLYLLINSPGGLVQSSYKVAKALRKNFKNIIVFVPHLAASGGTLIALVGNEIIMGMMSQLSPLDPHSEDGGSALSTKRGFQFITEKFKNLSERDAPYTYKVLAESCNAADIDAALSVLVMMENYAEEILTKSGLDSKKSHDIAKSLVEGFNTHEEVIDFDKAQSIGLNVFEYTKYPEMWGIFRQWLSEYLLQSADKHIIRYWVNTGGENDGAEEVKSS